MGLPRSAGPLCPHCSRWKISGWGLAFAQSCPDLCCSSWSASVRNSSLLVAGGRCLGGPTHVHNLAQIYAIADGGIQSGLCGCSSNPGLAFGRGRYLSGAGWACSLARMFAIGIGGLRAGPSCG